MEPRCKLFFEGHVDLQFFWEIVFMLNVNFMSSIFNLSVIFRKGMWTIQVHMKSAILGLRPNGFHFFLSFPFLFFFSFPSFLSFSLPLCLSFFFWNKGLLVLNFWSICVSISSGEQECSKRTWKLESLEKFVLTNLLNIKNEISRI